LPLALGRHGTSPLRNDQIKKTETSMKSVSGKVATSVTLLTLAASAAMLPSAADAADYCYNSATGGSSCTFTSMEQCHQMAMGRAGWCSHVIDWSKAPGYSGSYAYDRGGRGRKPVAPPSDMPVKGEGGQ
jgi:Protein of unknown function (DUF3551)